MVGALNTSTVLKSTHARAVDLRIDQAPQRQGHVGRFIQLMAGQGLTGRILRRVSWRLALWMRCCWRSSAAVAANPYRPFCQCRLVSFRRSIYNRLVETCLSCDNRVSACARDSLRMGSGSGFAFHERIGSVGLSEIDRNLLERCLQRKPRAWEDFVDRFMGLFIHVANHTARARSVRLTPTDRDDLCARCFLPR